MKIKVTLLALSVLVFGLGSRAFAADEPQITNVLFVVSGGYTSCGSQSPEPTGIGLYEPFRNLSAELSTKAQPIRQHYIVTCFKSDAPPTGKTLFFTSKNPKKVRTGNAKDLMAEIEDFAQREKDLKVILIGHSYGGWQAMYISQNLKPSISILALFTVDPISPQCGPFQVVFGGGACKRAPNDLKNDAIAERAGSWLNFYQNQDSWLHSGPMQGPQENFHIQYRGPHTQIDSDDRTWAEIRSELIKNLY